MPRDMADEHRAAGREPMTVPAACSPDAHGQCAVCADEGLECRVLSLYAAAGTARVMLDGIEQSVALDLVDGVGAGDRILVHLGFAIARLEAA